MNKRIQQLLEQATIIGEPGYPDSKFEYFDKEKFAELLVKECAQVCRDQPNIYAMKLDRDNCAIAIEEHFGVEE